MNRRSSAILLFLILLLGALVRLAPLCVNGGDREALWSADSQLYWDLATNVADFGDFVREKDRYSIERIENPWATEIFRTPGYPWFLAGLFKMGIRFPSGVVLIQIFLDLVCIVLTYLFATRLVSSRVAVMATLLVAVDLSRIVQANMIMSDILFSLFMLLSFIQAISLRKESSISGVVLLAITLGLASTVRPVGLIVGIIYAVFFYARTRRISASLLLLVMSLSFPVLWTVRNYLSTGQLTPSSALEYNLYLVTAAKVKARAEGIPYAKAGELLSQAMLQDLDKHGADVWKESLKGHGAPIFFQYPVQTVVELGRAVTEMLIAGERRHLLRILQLPGGEADVTSLTEGRRKVALAFADFLPARPIFEIILVLIQGALNFVILTLALVGWRRVPDRLTRWFLLVVALYFIGSSIVVATARMRIPITPILVVLAACGAAPRRCFEYSRIST